MEPGQYLDTWGARMNAQGGSDLVDASLDGVEDFALSGSKTLTNNNGASDEARKRGLNITGGTGGTITIPNVDKIYFVRNNSSGDVVITTGSGTTATIKTGLNKWVMCDGANNVYQASGPAFGSADISTTGTLASGAQTVTGTIAATDAISATKSTNGTFFGFASTNSNAGSSSTSVGYISANGSNMELTAYAPAVATYGNKTAINVAGTATAFVVRMNGTPQTEVTANGLFLVNHGTTASAANGFIDSGSSPVGRLLRSTSSRRYKTNIEDIPLSECLRIVRALRSISYTSLAPSDDPAKVFFGLIAEEVARVSVHLVHWTPLTDDIEIDADTPTMEGPNGETLIPDGVMYDRVCVIQNKVLNHSLDRIEALEAA